MTAAGRVGNLEGAFFLTHFFESLASLEDRRALDDVRIVQFGDSHTASDTATCVVRRLLQSRFGDGGRGFVQLGRPWKTYVQSGITGGMTKEFEPLRARVQDGRDVGDGAYGLLGVALQADRAAASAWTKTSEPASRLEFDVWLQPAGGSANVFVDGVPTGHIATRAPSPAPGYFVVEVADAPHQIEVRTVGKGDVRIFGLALDRARVGVVVDALGINGAQVYTPLHSNQDHFAEQLGHRAPTLVILAYGTNESLDPKLDLGAYEHALVELVGRVTRAAPGASCLLLGPPDLARRDLAHRDWATWPPVLDVVAIQQRVARAAGCAFFDQLEAMGGPGSMAAWAGLSEPLAQSDRVHLTLAGYAQIGTAFAMDLMRAYDGWRALRLHVDSTGVRRPADGHPVHGEGGDGVRGG
ncbi:MAG: GDSL-type esterase/lipase family protein [Polyangiaceae bacterium]|jgi:lysophospholipase L1-like esterase